MPIKFPPLPRTVLLCDYGKGGFVAPEMVKRRPAIVISPRLRHRDGLCTVVPLSMTEPEHAVPYVVKLDLPWTLPPPFEQRVCWAKCDMIATVGFGRLDLFRTERDHMGKRKYLTPQIDDASFDKIKAAILAALGFLTNPPFDTK